jgi:hypothetical protein
MTERQKLSDLRRDFGSIFGGPPARTWQEAWPEFETLSAKVAESTIHRDGEFVDWNGRAVVDCSNPHCYGGGVALDEVIAKVYGRRLEHDEEKRMCAGYEGSPKGRRRHRRCLQMFRVVVDATYKTQA